MRLLFALKEIINKLSKDNIAGYAAQSCFYIILSFFPFIMLMLTLIRFLPIELHDLIDIFNQLAPPQIHSLLQGIVSDLYNGSSITLTSVTAVTTLWAAGKGVMSLMKGFNSIYNIEESRNFFVQRILASIYTLIFIVTLACTLVVLVFGSQLINLTASSFPNISKILQAIMDKRTILFACLLMLVFMMLYKFIPNRKTTFVREIPGAALATLGWYIFSHFYSVYVNHSTNFSIMYGSLATFIFALIWLYACMIIIFFGAEFNTFIEHEIISFKMFGFKLKSLNHHNTNTDKKDCDENTKK